MFFAFIDIHHYNSSAFYFIIKNKMEKQKSKSENSSVLELKSIYESDYRLKCWNYWKLTTVLWWVSTFLWYLFDLMWNSWLTGWIMGLVWIAICYFNIIFTINRFHDLWKSGWSIFLLLIPFYNIYLTCVLRFSKGDKNDNEYGKYMDRQIIFNEKADKVFDILTKVLLILSWILILGVLMIFVLLFPSMTMM